MKKVFRIGEYFCGPGGMAYGAILSEILTTSMLKELDGSEFDEIEFEPVFAVDYHKDACLTYFNNILPFDKSFAKFISTDDQVDTSEIPGIDVQQGDYPLVLHADVKKVNPTLLGDVDGFVFGFPCNDFSIAGKSTGLDGDYGMLYRQGIDLINEKKPLFFIAENVSGILSANNWGAFKKIMGELREAASDIGGYEITPHLYKFEEYGVPQTRHRVIMVGIRKDSDITFKPPAPTGETTTARQALEGIYEAGGLSNENPTGLRNNFHKKLSDVVQKRIELTPPGKNIWDVNEYIPVKLRLNVKKAKMSSIYKVIDPDKPSYTVVGSGGGGTHMYHWDKRATTNRERAALQTFPNDFEFEGNMTSVRKQIGMAVPPAGAAMIFTALVKTLLGIPYDDVKPNLTKAENSDYIEKKIKNREIMKIKNDKKKAIAIDEKMAKEQSITNEMTLEVQNTEKKKEVESV